MGGGRERKREQERESLQMCEQAKENRQQAAALVSTERHARKTETSELWNGRKQQQKKKKKTKKEEGKRSCGAGVATHGGGK